MNMLILAARDKETGIPENFGGLEWKDVTTIHPVGLIVVLFLGIVMLFLPRRWAVFPMLLIACFIPSIQKIVVFGMDFTLLRIMVVFGVIRLLIKKEYTGFFWQKIDKVLVAWVVSSVLVYTLQQGNISALINRLGFAFDAFGMYFMFRCLIRDWADLNTTVFGCLLISIPVMIAFLIENRTGRNMFSVFGGVPEITKIRDGRLRCQGAFSHPILAGCFWASLMPLFVSFGWKSFKNRIWSVMGVVSSLIIIVCCASSTPLMSAMAAILGWVSFCFRKHMRYIRWGIFLLLIVLHIVMSKPVWHLISRVSAVGGSTSWHRYNLIDQTIKHFGEWYLVGIRSTVHWGVVDLTNQYVLEAVRGGLITLTLFIVVIVYAFQSVGQLICFSHNSYHRAFCWSLGVCLFVHCMSFIGVSYFGQIYIIWYILLAMIGSIYSGCVQYESIQSSRFK